MDTKVLLNLIDDLLREEKAQDLNSKIRELIDVLTKSNQSANSNSENINVFINQIRKLCDNSFTNSITKSQTKIFRAITGHEYFGFKLKDEIDHVFAENQYNLQSTIIELQKIFTKREKFISTITSVKENLTSLSLEPHYFIKEIYEIGVIIPDIKGLHYAPSIEKQIHNWNFVFKTLAELTGNEVMDVKIDRVSNGCIELFFHQLFEVAEIIGIVLTKIAFIYVTIKEIKKHREELKQLKVPLPEIKAIEDHEKKLIENAIEEVTDEIIRNHTKKTEQQRRNELKTGLNKSIRFIARTIDNGIEVEIIPPYIGANDDTETDEVLSDESKKLKEQKAIEKKKKEERIAIIKKSGGILKDVSEIGNGVLKLLSGGDDKLEDK